MSQETSLTWTRVLNIVGSALIAFLAVFILFVVVIGSLGQAGAVVLFVSWVIITALLYGFSEWL